MNEKLSPTQRIAQKSCVCSSLEGLFIPNRHLSVLIAGIVMVLGATFLSGYFWALKMSNDSVLAYAEQDAFTDQIQATMSTMQSVEHVATDACEPISVAVDAERVADSYCAVPNPEKGADQYYAQLCGFGKKQAAQAFASRLIKRSIPARVATRYSKNSKGKMIPWYQVVTEPYADKIQLEHTIALLKESDKLKDPRILNYTMSTKKGEIS